MSKNVVVIGGGTGSFVVLSGLKKFAQELNLSAVVTVADSGGSAKQERDEFGLLPISDVRKALLALSGGNNRQQVILRRLFTYRFNEGGSGLEGGTFGNLFLVALTKILGSETAAIQEAEKILQTAGQVIPVALRSSNLIIEYTNGQIIVGEHYLDNFPGDGTVPVKRIYLLPPLKANPEAIEQIKKADLIIFPPGDFFASILVNLKVEEITSAIKKSQAPLLYILNLMTKYGQTYHWKASEHIHTLEEHLSCPLNFIFVNNKKIPPKTLTSYKKEKDFPVRDDLGNDQRVIRADYLAKDSSVPEKGDSIKRSLIRHDPEKVTNQIMKLVGAN